MKKNARKKRGRNKKEEEEKMAKKVSSPGLNKKVSENRMKRLWCGCLWQTKELAWRKSYAIDASMGLKERKE